MKILLINKFHYLRGGAEKAYFDTARILEAHGHTVAFFSMHHPKNIKTPFEKYFVEYVDYHHKYSIQNRFLYALRILWNREAQKNLEKLIQDFQPDVAHLHNIYHQLSPSIIATFKKNSIPMAMTLHDYKLISPNYSLFVRGHTWEGGGYKCLRDCCVGDSFLRSLVCSLEYILHRTLGVYKKVDLFLSPSHFLKEKFQERGFRGDIRVIHQPVSLTEQIVPVMDKEEYFVYAGRLSQEKGVTTLIEAISKTKNSRLKILGDGPQKKFLEQYAQESDVGDRIEFLGHLSYEQAQQETKKAKAVIIPSLWYENMPYALVEALGAGHIVITSRRGGMKERIHHKENGLLFEPGNAKELAYLLEHIDSFDLSGMQEKARESVKGFEKNVYYQELIALYQELLEKKK